MIKTKTHLKAAKKWLLKMQNSSGGFSGSFSFIYGRRPDFAEVSGYIIPTLINLGEVDRAQRAGDWLLSIQNKDGWFYHWPAPDKPMVFDTAQIIFGFLALYKNAALASGAFVRPQLKLNRPGLAPRFIIDNQYGLSTNFFSAWTRRESNPRDHGANPDLNTSPSPHGDSLKYLKAASKAGDWLCSVQEPDGRWIKYAYQGIPHTYYSRASWALLELWKITGDEKYKNTAIKQLDWVLRQQREDGSFANCSFFADGNPVLHVVAYTIEGLLHSGLILNEEKYKEAAKKGLNWQPTDYWNCLTGLAQMSCILFKFYEQTKDKTYLKEAWKINFYLKSKQILNGPGFIKGALAGSYPIWKRYMPFSLPVWSVKFWIDALLWEEKYKNDYLIAAIFPCDSLSAYIKKGEMRKKYFNPDDLFSEIRIFDPLKINYSDEEKKQLQFMMGGADFSFLKYKTKTTADVVRAYGVGWPAYYAYKLSKKLNVPLIISLHGNYDLDNRYYVLRRGQILKYLYYTLWRYLFVKKLLKKAQYVLPAYQFAADFASSVGVPENKIKLIYNKVYPDIFYPMPNKKNRDFTLIVVGRLIVEKNQETIIRAVKDLNVKLMIVGQGPEEQKLKELAESLKIKDKIQFIEKVNNKEMALLYNQAHVYVTANKYGGMEIPVIEAMACGLPIIRSKHPLEKKPELLGFEGCLYAKNTPEDFTEAIKKIMNDNDLRNRLSRKSLEIYQSINGNKMEQEEKLIYLSVI